VKDVPMEVDDVDCIEASAKLERRGGVGIANSEE